ncbi:glycosyltransferase family 2 protein, partial [Vibrio breoganii]|uniref:glycosyltransferase family 2 protein n=1 Tax=Vibrio breoganii TaxID=553239 RepID=UPI0010552936
MKKLFSLIIPTYGRPIKLGRLLESIDSQSIEIIVVDDNGLGSENQNLTEKLICDNRYDVNYCCLKTNSGA